MFFDLSRKSVTGEPDPGPQVIAIPEFSPNEALQQRLPHYHPDIPVLVAWAQKAGCTSVLKWFLFQAGLLEEAIRFISPDVSLDVHAYEDQVFKAGADYKASVFAALEAGLPLVNFVRCPYQRAFSSYLQIHNRFFINQERKGIDSPGFRVRRSVLRFVYGEHVSVEYPISFYEYLQWLEQSSPAELDPHHSPQHSAIYAYPNIRHYRLEDFAAVTARLAREYGLKTVEEGQLGAGHHREKSEVPLAVTMKLLQRSVPLNASPQFQLPQVTREMLAGTEFAAIIQRVFRDDIALYDSLPIEG